MERELLIGPLEGDYFRKPFNQLDKQLFILNNQINRQRLALKKQNPESDPAAYARLQKKLEGLEIQIQILKDQIAKGRIYSIETRVGPDTATLRLLKEEISEVKGQLALLKGEINDYIIHTGLLTEQEPALTETIIEDQALRAQKENPQEIAHEETPGPVRPGEERRPPSGQEPGEEHRRSEGFVEEGAQAGAASASQPQGEVIVERPAIIAPDDPVLSQNLLSFQETREKYLQTKKTARSLWGTLTESVRSRFTKDYLDPDTAMGKAREEYEVARNRYILTMATTRINPVVDWIGNQTVQAGAAAELYMQEMLLMSQRELELNENDRTRRALSHYYRHPWIRMGVGWGVNLGIGASMAAGLLPVTAVLTGIRIGMGTIGTEGGIHGVQDLITRHSGKRQGLTPELVRQLEDEDLKDRLASFYEDRIRKQYALPEDPQATENLLMAEYGNRLRDRLLTYYPPEVPADREIYINDLLERAKKLDQPNVEKDQALIDERNASAARWVVAALLAVGLTAFLHSGRLADWGHRLERDINPRFGDIRRDLKDFFDRLGDRLGVIRLEPPIINLPPISGVSPEIPKTPAELFGVTDYQFPNPDSLYEALIHNNEISSIKGLAEGQLAIHDFGMVDFNPNNPADIAAFQERFNQNPLLNFKKTWAWIDFDLNHTRSGAFVPTNQFLGQHFVDNRVGFHSPTGPVGELNNFKVPRDVKRFFDSITTDYEIKSPIPFPYNNSNKWVTGPFPLNQ